MEILPVTDGKFDGKEGLTLEFKSALKGIPASTWETYSAFANTFGGKIILGINDSTHEIEGVPNTELRLQDIWNVLNNKQVINHNILRSDNVEVHECEGKKLIIINVPRAPLSLRPIYYKSLETGTYKRNGEGDFCCSRFEIGAMFRDQTESSYDSTLLDGTSTDDIDIDTLSSFRNYMKVAKPGHSWNAANNEDFLKMIGATGRNGDKNELTVAGLLMFGKEYVIYRYFPNYKLDYQEFREPWPKWDFRVVTGDGTWSGNVFGFYTAISNRIVFDLSRPFVIGDNMQRIMDTDADKAVRECLLNSLTNADYLGNLVIKIERDLEKIRISNSGLFRVPLELAMQGGESDPRNKIIAKMFSLLGLLERTGVGINYIFKVWGNQYGSSPTVIEDTKTQRVTFELKTRLKPAIGKLDERIIELISSDSKITISHIAESLSVSRPTVANHIRYLETSGLVERIGGPKGFWKVK